MVAKEFTEEDCPCCSENRGPRRIRPWSWTILIALSYVATFLATAATLLRYPDIAHYIPFAMSEESGKNPIVNNPIFGNKIRFDSVHPASDAWIDSRYTGTPSPSGDTAWENLQAVRGIVLQPDQARALDLPNSGLSTHNGTVAGLLGVQHNLHCIRIVYQAFYPEYYYPTQRSKAESRARMIHVGHCLEAIRQSVMCTPDLTPRAMRWEDDERLDIAIIPSVDLQCLDWDNLVERMKPTDFTLDELWEANPS